MCVKNLWRPCAGRARVLLSQTREQASLKTEPSSCRFSLPNVQCALILTNEDYIRCQAGMTTRAELLSGRACAARLSRDRAGVRRRLIFPVLDEIDQLRFNL